MSHTPARMIETANMDSVRFHDLRHTFASLVIMRNSTPKVISKAQGYASVAFTMDTYNHIIGGIQKDAIALLDEVLPAGMPQKFNAKHQHYGKLEPVYSFRRGVRVAYGDGLENRCPRKGTVGSNPTPSAIIETQLIPCPA